MTSRREQFRAIFLAAVMVVSMVAMGATALAGSAAADEIESDDVGGDVGDALDVSFNDRSADNTDPVSVYAGGGEEQLPRLDIVDDDGIGAIAGYVDITLPENLTFNPEESDISVTGDVDEGTDNFEFEDDNQRLSFDLDESSNDEEDRFSITGIVVDTDTVDVDLEEDESEKFDIEVDTADGEPADYERIQIFKNTIDDGETEVPADSDSGLEDNVVLNVPNANEFFDRDDFSQSLNNLPVAEGSDVVISPNTTAGITFEVDEMDSDDIEFADRGVMGDDDGDIDVDNIEISEEEVRLPVNESFQTDTFLDIEDGLTFAAAPDADDTTELSISYEPTNSTGVVEAHSNYDIEVVNPDFAVFDNDDTLVDIAAGVDDQEISGDFDISDLDEVEASSNYAPFAVTPTDDNQITTDQNITLVMNSSEVTFSENNEDELSVAITNDDEAITQDGLNVHTTVDEAADESMLTFELDEDEIDDNLYDEDGVFNHQQAIAVGAGESSGDGEPIAINVSNDVEEDDRVGFELLTGDDDEVVSEQDEGDETILEVNTVSLDADLYEDEDEILVDDAGADGYELGLELTMAASNDDSVTPIAADTNVTVDLSQTEFEFDQRSDFEPEDSAINTDRVGIDANTLEFQFDEDVDQGDDTALFNTEHGALNFTAGAADVDGADMEITTDSSDSEMSITETVDTVDLEVDGLGALDDRDDLGDEIGLGDTVTIEDLEAGEEETAWVFAGNESEYSVDGIGSGEEDLWPYGGADVSLDVEEHPSGVENPNDRLNTTSVETAALDAADSDEWGYAGFNFTGTVTGEYTVNATVGDSHVLFNYSVDATDKEALSVEGEENAFAGQVDEISDVENDEDQKYRTGIYNVTVEDEFGNLVEDDSVRVQAASSDVRVLGYTDSLSDGVPEDDATVNEKSFDENLVGDSVEVDFSDSSFFVVADTAGGSPVDAANLELETVGTDDDVEHDDGDVRFYDDAADGEFATEELEEDVTEMTLTFHTEDGDTIEVPGIDSTLETDNTSVVTFEGDDEIDESTDTAGEIVFNLSHEGVGIANITSEVDLDNDAYDDLEDVEELETTFEVEDEPPADFQITTFDDIEIVEGDTTDVEVTIENDGGQDGEQTVTLDVEDVGELEQDVEIDEGETEDVTFEDVATDDLEPDTYDMDVETEDDSASAELEVLADAADLSVTLDDVEIFEGNTTDIDVEIDNDGVADAEDVEVELDIDDGEITVDDTVDVDSGDSVTVTFEDVETDDLEEGDYDMEATATHDDDSDSDTATLTVEEVEEEDDGIPGFTAGIAALALLGAALLALRLRNEE